MSLINLLGNKNYWLHETVFTLKNKRSGKVTTITGTIHRVNCIVYGKDFYVYDPASNFLGGLINSIDIFTANGKRHIVSLRENFVLYTRDFYRNEYYNEVKLMEKYHQETRTIYAN